MSATPTRVPTCNLEARALEGAGLCQGLPRLQAYAGRGPLVPLTRDPAWLLTLEEGLGHHPYCLEAVEGTTTRGILPLAHVRSLLFGRFLVGLPYLNSGGVLADDDRTTGLLLDAAAALAGRLGVRYLELRHERAVEHPALTQRL